MDSERNHRPRSYDDGGRATSWLLAAAGIAVLFVHFAASRSYSNWLWGFNYYYFLPRTATLLILAIGCVLCFPPVRKAVFSFGDRATPHLKLKTLSPVVADALWASGFGVVFWLLRMPLHFLGDGRLVIRLLDQGMWFHPYEPLDRLIHAGLLRATEPLFGWNSEMVYTVLSVAAGVVYAFAAFRLGRRVGARVFVPAFLLTTGIVQLFMGYAESYSLVTAAMLVYLLLAIEYLSGIRKLVWAATALIVSASLHLSAAFLVPSFLYLIWVNPRAESRRRAGRLVGATAAVVILLVLAGVAYRSRPHEEVASLLVPISESEIAQYTLFSWQHLVDFLNEQILISPLAWIAALVCSVTVLRNPELRRCGRFWFLGAASVVPLAFNLVLRPGLGGSRDWDLWSLGSTPYVVATAWCVAWIWGRRPSYRAVAWTLVVVGFIHIVPWVGVNRSERLTIERLDRMLEDNPLWTDRRIAAARNELGGYYWERNLVAESAEQYRRALLLQPDRAGYWNDFGSGLLKLGRLSDAEAAFRRATELDPDHSNANYNLGHVYLAKGEGEKALEAYRRACRADPQSPHSWQGLGAAALILGRVSDAEIALRRAVELDPHCFKAHFNLAQIYRSRGEMDRAVEAFRSAAQSSPRDPMFVYQLAMLLHELPGREREAMDAWRTYLVMAAGDSSQQALVGEARKRVKELQDR